MSRLTDLVLRHRLWVALAWVAVAVAGGVTAPTTVDRLSYDFALPGQPAYETNQDIVETFGVGGVDDPLLLVVTGDDAQRTAVGVARQATQAVDGLLTVTGADDGADALTSSDGQRSVVVLYPPVTPGPEPYAASQPVLEEIAAGVGDGSEAVVTGFVPLTEGGGGGDDRSVLVEVVLGGAGALVVLVLVFASLLAGVPLLVAAVSILGTFLALLGLTTITDVSFVVQYLVALIGLGVAIDYSLLVVTRWREERSAGAENDEAVRTAMRTAGHSVLVSGFTVAVSLAALVLVPLPFLRSIGLGGLLIPLFSVATALTLVPALLSAVGGRLLWPTGRRPAGPSRFWGRVARGVLRHRWLTILGSGVVLVALAAPVLGLTLGSPQLSGITSSSPESDAVEQAVDDGLPTGVLRPTLVLLGSDDAAAGTEAVDRLAGVDGVAATVAPEAWRADGEQLALVWSEDDPASDDGRAPLTAVRDLVDDGGAGDAAVGGSPAEDADFVTAVYEDAPWVVLAVVVVTFVLLARALRSLWLPVKALLLNVISIGAAYGVTVLIWQEGYGSQLLFGQDATGVITTWVPIAAFAFLFGLSMDYEVFILSRMRESHDELPSTAEDGDGAGGAGGVLDEHDRTDRAVVDGIAHTGRLVTSAALILFLAFIALSTVPSVEVKILATALALGIAIDAVVVRSLLAPALVGVLGRANWTLPAPLAKVLLVRERGRHEA